MSARRLALAAVLCATAVHAHRTTVRTVAARPTLVVLVIVDQLREPLLERYDDLFTGGFRRLIDQGRFYTNATHDHALTETAVGHATLSTGVYPMRHGIVANEWSERTAAGWQQVSNVGDSTVRIVGRDGLPGVSPHALMRTGFADWLVAADPRSQVASVSAKDRGAILPAAHAKGQVYWFDNGTGRFVTSSYYRATYPAWVDAFNDRVMPTHRGDTVWASTVPAAALGRSMPDTSEFEGNGVDTYFPHRFAAEGRPNRFWDWYAATPLLDASTLEFAQTMVTSLALGADDAPDFLNVSLSQTDRVGHAYSPLSREQLDNLLRLDRELGAFFTFLDQRVGAGKWSVVLSADHGSLVAPEHLPQPGEPASGRRITRADMDAMQRLVDAANRDAADPRMPTRLVAGLKRLPFVANAWTHADLQRASRDSFAVLERRSLYPGRAGAELTPYGVEVQYAEGFLNRPRGSGHGSPWWYDRHVPIVVMGAGITPGKDRTRVATVDVAPTLAALLGVKTAGGLDGKPLAGVAGEKR